MESRPSMRTLTGEPAYHKFTEYLTRGELDKLEKGMASLPATLTTDEELAQQIEAGNWVELFNKKKPAFEHFPLQALRCLRKGLINAMTFSTSQMYFNIFAHPDHANHSIRVEPIHNTENGTVNKTAQQMLSATMRLYGSSYLAFCEQNNQEFIEQAKHMKDIMAGPMSVIFEIIGGTKSQYDTSAWRDPDKKNLSEWDAVSEKKFYQLMASLPRSEQNFLILPEQHHDGVKFTKKNSVSKQINFDLGLNALSRFRLKGVPVVMIPSRGMMQAFLEATRGENTPEPFYRFGLSPVDQLFATMKAGGRDMLQSFAPLAHLTPNEVDGFPSSLAYAEAEYHDFFHQRRASNVPANDTALFIAIAEYFFQTAKSDDTCREYANLYAAELIDMEHGPYELTHQIKNPTRADKYRRNSDKFWHSVEQHQPKKLPSVATNNLNTLMQQMKFLTHHFATYLLEHENEFEKQFGLSLETLMEFKCDIQGGFLHQAQEEIKSRLENLTKNRSLTGLLLTIPSVTGRIQREAIAAGMKKLIIEDISSAAVLAHKHQSSELLELIIEIICSKFRKLLNNGSLSTLKSAHPDVFTYVMAELRKTRDGENLLVDAIRHYDSTPAMFELLYDKHHVNDELVANNSTLIYQAVSFKDIECLLRLTNDGAYSDKPQGPKKITPSEKASELDCIDIQAVLAMAKQHGKGWVNKHSAEVKRIRGLAAHRVNRDNHTMNSELKQDIEWAEKLVRKTSSNERIHTGDQNSPLFFGSSTRGSEKFKEFSFKFSF